MKALAALLVCLLAACSSHARDSEPAGSGSAQASIAAAYAAYDAQDWTSCAALAGTVGRRGRDDAADALYLRAHCLARAGRSAEAVASLQHAVDEGWADVAQLDDDQHLAPLRQDARWSKIESQARANVPRAPALRDELLAMVAEDQAARAAWVVDVSDQAAERRVRDVDARNRARLKQIVAEHGWPGYRLVARDGAQAAWLLVQHADYDPVFQKRCLVLLASAVAMRDARGMQYAYLADRVAVMENRPQRYGTQFRGDVPHPIDDPDNVEARRAAVGLGTLAAYAAQLRALPGSATPD